jgi:cobalt-zinc-cadmium efflux system outer membrane protein
MTLKAAAGVSITLCAVASLARAQTGPPALPVTDLVDMAMQRNRDFLAATQRIAETQGLLRQAGVRPAPALDIEESTSRPFGSDGEQVFSAGYSHTFETFGKRDKRIAVAEITAEAVKADLADRVRRLTFDVKTKYAHAVRDQQKLEAIQRLSSTNREYYKLTDARVQRGDAAPLEGQLFLTELSRVEAQEVVLAGTADRALLELRTVVGVPPTEPLSLAPPELPAATRRSLSDLQTQGLRDRADLRVLKLLEDQALAEEALAHAEGKPDMTASAHYSRTNSKFDQLGYDQSGKLVPVQDRDNVLTVGLSILLFPPKRNLGAIEAAQARSAAARLQREHLESVVHMEVEAAYRRWQSAVHAVDILSHGVIGQSEKNLAVVRLAHTAGQLRILDVLNEQRRLIETQVAYLDAQSELFEAFAELEASVGGSIQ